MLSFLNHFNTAVIWIFTLMYSYQMFYAVVALLHRKKENGEPPKKLHKFAVLIAARNESLVIGELIRSIKRQNYPQELLDVIVVADNCTDNTAEVARECGAICYERFNQEQVGKGYAMDYGFRMIEQNQPDAGYEGYFILDADNLLDPNYVAEMNKVFDKGFRVITSYRNSKNYDSNWISAGYSLWFLREAKYLNNPRMLLKTSCAVSGTGFLIHSDIIKKSEGWKYHLLTEDIEFSIDSVIQGERFAYCGDAILYDEQPCTFQQSWTQRMRWAKGFYQVLGKYGKDLVKSIFKKGHVSFAAYDMLMTITPAVFVTVASVLVNTVALIFGLTQTVVNPMLIPHVLNSLVLLVVDFYLMLFAFGLLTTITEWKRIHCKAWKKIWYTFTFPLFMLTYVPIAIVALFKKVEWKPIHHNVVKAIDDLGTGSGK